MQQPFRVLPFVQMIGHTHRLNQVLAVREGKFEPHDLDFCWLHDQQDWLIAPLLYPPGGGAADTAMRLFHMTAKRCTWGAAKYRMKLSTPRIGFTRPSRGGADDHD